MQTYPRTHYEAVLDIRYAARFCLLQRRLYMRTMSLFLWVELIGGSAAFAGWLGNSPALAAWAALTLAIVAAANIVIDPAEKRMLCERQRRRWTALDARAPGMTLEELDLEITQLRAEEIPEIELLRQPAFNDAMRENGRTDALVPLTFAERMVSTIA